MNKLTQSELRMQMLAGVITESEYATSINQEVENTEKDSLNEHYVAGGIVGIGAINQIPCRAKADYEDAFEYFLSQKYSINEEMEEEEELEEGKEVEEPTIYEDESLEEDVVKGSNVKKVDGKYRVLSGKSGKMWPQTYDSKKDAEDAIKAYHAKK